MQAVLLGLAAHMCNNAGANLHLVIHLQTVYSLWVLLQSSITVSRHTHVAFESQRACGSPVTTATCTGKLLNIKYGFDGWCADARGHTQTCCC